MDRRGAVFYFAAMIRSFLTMLAALALMFVSLTASANAMRMDDDMGHALQQAHGIAAPLAETGIVAACEGMGDLCAFACAGLAKPVTPARLQGPCAYGAAAFFVARTPLPAGYGPEQAERPPRF